MSRSPSTPTNRTAEPERPPWRIGPSELLLIFAFWTFIATLSSVNRVLDPRGFGFRMSSPAAPVAGEFIEAWVWAAVTPFVFWLSSRYSVERSNWAIRVPLLLAVGVGVAIGVHLLVVGVRMQILPLPPRRMATFSPVRDIVRLRFINQLLVYLAVLAAGFARNFYLRDLHRQKEAVMLQGQTAQLQAQLADARLDALRMQLNPHFLFNTLHAVSALVERDPSGVRRMIARLSELLRRTVDSRGSDEVPLRNELDFLRRYIEIMEIRFQGHLSVETNASEEALDALVPNLILQPIVENALEHGASRATGEGKVQIAARRDGESLVVTVQDNGPGLPVGETKSGVGLGNSSARLEQLYGDAASLDLSSEAGGGVLARIVIPFHTSRDLRTRTDG